MIKEGLSFYIPTKENGVDTATNFNRSNEPIQDDNVVSLFDLNKSDYLFQTIILFIVRKIRNVDIKESERLYRLIGDIEHLTQQIYLRELKMFDISLDYIDSEIFNENMILAFSKKLAGECLEERIFDYAE